MLIPLAAAAGELTGAVVSETVELLAAAVATDRAEWECGAGPTVPLSLHFFVSSQALRQASPAVRCPRTAQNPPCPRWAMLSRPDQVSEEFHVAHSSQEILDGRIGLDAALLGSRIDPAQRSPAHLACLNGRGDWLRELGERGADLTQPDAAGRTPLHVAAATGEQFPTGIHLPTYITLPTRYAYYLIRLI